METGSLPSTTVYGTWVENVELWDTINGGLFNLSSVTEVTLKLRDIYEKFDELTLTKSNGDIVIPSDGIIQWRVEAGQMGTLKAKLYEVVLLIEDDTDTVPIILGTVSVRE